MSDYRRFVNRYIAGRTLAEVASELDVHVQTVWRWTKGERTPETEYVSAMLRRRPDLLEELVQDGTVAQPPADAVGERR